MVATIQLTVLWLPVSFLKTKIKIHETIILPVVLHGCETWSHALKEEESFRVTENRVLRRIFGSKRGGKGWRRLHKEEFHNLHASLNIIRVIKSRRMGWEAHVAHMGEMRKCIQYFGWKTWEEEATLKT
jgi:hypothetical protein